MSDGGRAPCSGCLRRRLRRAREAAPRHAEYLVGFGPGRARPRRQSQSERQGRNSHLYLGVASVL
eukprot:COSAG06_NODE_266_length_18831_cov_301.960015_10_plen_65_part_00